MVEAGLDRQGRGWRAGWRGAAEDAWRLIGIGLLAVGAFLLFMRLRVVMLPLFAGALLATLVAPFAEWQRSRGVPRGIASLISVFGVVIAVLALTVGAVSLAVGDTDELSASLSDSGDDLADWLVDGPADLERRDVQDARDDLGKEAGEAARRWARGGGLAKSTTTALEVLAGAILSVLVGFFLIKDSDRLGSSAVGLWRPERRDRVRATARAGIEGLRGYLRACLMLGLVEGTIIGVAVAILASPSMGAPIAVLTLIAAFVPIVGAIVAGVLAVLVTLAEGGIVAALVVAVVALVVQQLDNDVLAPWIFGKNTQLHPLAVLVAVTAGGALAGIAGAFIAVPLGASVTAMVNAWRKAPDPPPPDGSPGGPDLAPEPA